jgi:hypothetical protein
MNTPARHKRPGYLCWTCLDFGKLPAIGPCPDCRPGAYVDHLIIWWTMQQLAEFDQGEPPEWARPVSERHRGRGGHAA